MITSNPAIDQSIDDPPESKKQSIDNIGGGEGIHDSHVIEIDDGDIPIRSPEVIDMTGEDDADVEDDGEVDLEVDDDDDDDIEIIEDDEDEDVVVVNDKPKTLAYPIANDFSNLAGKLMKPIQDYPVKDQTHFVWEIKEWSQLKEDKVRSPRFKCGGFEWNILLFPRGNSNNNMISVYMEPHPPVDEEGNPIDDNWYVCAQFGLDVWNPEHPEAHLPSGSSHRFTKNETDWGFSSLIDLKQLASANTARNTTPYPILENNKLNITGYVKVIDDSSTGVLWHSFIDYDSKKASGYVGLNNQGATCYLNSLLQSYFTTKCFRKLVYEIPTDSISGGVPLSLQRIFYLLSTSNDPVGTLELTKSFGWDSSDAFTQHDVQELNRILMDKLETAMKGSNIEGKLNDIFVGKMKSYIKCVNVPYESSRVEDFWDIQLNVKGFQNLEDSFKNYIEIEMLEGENKYQAGDEHGYQDAKKGVVFEEFPPVLHLQLKRFEYDFMVDDLVKIDDFYEFPDKIDLKPYLDEDLSSDIKDQNWNYKLHGVLVHQGSISNGHYYAMIKPHAKDNTWLRFDDDKVWKVTPTQVFQDNFGAVDLTQEELSKMTRLEQQEHLMRRVTSAYMLVYYREEELPNILPDDDSVIDSSIPDHIPNQIKYELEQRDRLEKARQEALYYTDVKFITVNTLNHHVGFDLALDDTSARFYDESLRGTACDPLDFKVKKDDRFGSLYELAAKELGYQDTNSIRLLAVCHRHNHSNRVDAVLDGDLKNAAVSNVFSTSFTRKYDNMVLYVEQLNKDLRNINQLVTSSESIDPKDFKWGQVLSKIEEVSTEVDPDMKFVDIQEHGSPIIIFIKYFDPISQEIRGLSHMAVSKDDTIISIEDPIRQFLGFNNEITFDFFEELSPLKIEKINPTVTFSKQELSTGDIITVQIKDVEKLTEGKQFHNLKDYYRFMLTRAHISVRPFKADRDEEDSDFVANEENGNAKDQIETEDNEITNKEIETAKNLSKTFDMWVSSDYSYQQFAKEISLRLGPNVDPNYLRIFLLSNQGQRYPLKTVHHLSQFLAKTVAANQLVHFEYEILNIPLREYENLKAFKIHWLTSLLQYQVYELLVPKKGLVSDLVNKLMHKVNIPQRHLKHLLCWNGTSHSYYDLLKFDKPLSQIQDGVDLYCGIFPAEVEVLTAHDLIKRFTDEPVNEDEDFDNEAVKEEYILAKNESKNLNLIPVYHFYKNGDYRHGIPFIFIAFPNESFKETKERLRRKLGLGIQAFDKIKFALSDNNMGAYLNTEDESLNLFNEIGNSRSGSISLGLDHPDRSPKRPNQFDKGISIK
ncbi:UBP15 [[Candida] subhashii]|uniref:ubiquitinyl hydrolase 1 n=1 Tax=[Candida] subhashii TaxID=561895 RepID=A0A8J5QKH7_9ASCO|nr:UBP15 [[Candida] subhashii]KAG7662287.1 UBP15 [[Candida] subhashii]